jgi:hypothetical protein
VRSIENDDVTPKNCKPYKSGTHGFVLDLNAAEFTIKFYNFLFLLLGTILKSSCFSNLQYKFTVPRTQYLFELVLGPR